MSDASEAWDQAWHQLLGAAAPRAPRTHGFWELCEDAGRALCEGAGSGARVQGAARCLRELGADLLETVGAGLATAGFVAALDGAGMAVAAPAPGVALETAVRVVGASTLPAQLAVAHAGVEEGVEEEEEEPAGCPLLPILFPGYLGVRSALGALSILECVGFGVTLAVGAMVGDSMGLCTLYHLGAAWAPAMAQGGWWRLLAQIFLHANLQHLLTNIVFQCRLGFLLERELGSSRFSVLYVVSGVIGNLFSAAMYPFKLSVGASGSAFALLGASMLQLMTKWNSISPVSRHGRVLFYALILPTLFVNGGMDRWSHLGGCAAGGLIYLIFCPELNHRESRKVIRGVAMSALFGWCSFNIATVLEVDWSAAPQLACGTLLHPGSLFAVA